MDAFQGLGHSGIHGDRASGGILASLFEEEIERVIHKQYLNGTAPMLALLQGTKKEDVESTKFDWVVQTIENVSLPLTTLGGAAQAAGVYTNAARTTLYTNSGALGAIVYAQVLDAAGDHALMDQVRVRHEVLLRKSTSASMDCVGVVIDVVKGTGDDYIAIRLAQADPNTVGTTGWNMVRVIGSYSPENALAPEAITLKPETLYNNVQNFWDSVKLSDEALIQPLKIGDRLNEQKGNVLDLHTMQIEQAMIYGTRFEGFDPVTGEPYRLMMGLKNFAVSYGLTANYTEDIGDYLGRTFLEGGQDWLDDQFATIFKFGGPSRIAWVGTGVQKALKRIAQAYGTITIEPGKLSWGLAVQRLITDWGEIYMRTHPLFSHDSCDAYSMLIFDPKNVKYVRLKGRDTKYLPDKNRSAALGGDNQRDGITEGWRTKCSLKYYHGNETAFLTGVGQNNTLAA